MHSFAPLQRLWNKHPRAAGRSRDGLGEMSFGPGSLTAARKDDTPLADSFFTPAPSHTPGCVKQPSRRGVCVCVCVCADIPQATNNFGRSMAGFLSAPSYLGPGPRPVGACRSSFVFAALLAPKVLRLRTLAEDFHMVCLDPLQTDETSRRPAAHRLQCKSHGIIAVLWVKSLAGASQEIHPYPVTALRRSRDARAAMVVPQHRVCCPRLGTSIASVATTASHVASTADTPFAEGLQQPPHSPRSANAGLVDLARCTFCFGIACRLPAL